MKAFDIFDALTLIGGLCLFLFGMSIMGDALERKAGGSLKKLLGRLTSGKLKGFLTGLGVTAVIQSSSATTVMVVGFVNSKIMTLKQSINVIMGANIGTTVTAWVLSLGGISDDNIFLKLLKPKSFTPVLALIGIIYFMFSESIRKKDTGTILLGFAVLIFGMDTMSSSVSSLADIPQFRNMFLAFKNPLLGMLAGAVLTAVIQSSSASVGILQALSSTGAVSYAAAIPIIMGQNIGTTVTALLSSFGTNKNAKRAAIIHLFFNVIGTLVWLAVFSLINVILRPAIFHTPANYLGIAISHTVFNILCTLLLFPMSSLLEKIAFIIVPQGESPEKAVELDERLLASPAIAVAQCTQTAVKMAVNSTEGLKLSLKLLQKYDAINAEKIREIEADTDHYEDVLGTFLTKISRRQVTEDESIRVSKLLKSIGDFERIADHSKNLMESAKEISDKKIEFSDGAKKELCVVCDALSEILDITLTAFSENNTQIAYNVEPLEQVIDNLKFILRNRHILRLKNGECTVEAGFIWSDILTDIERVSDHCSNIALSVLETDNNSINPHESLRRIKDSNRNFDSKFKEYSEKYKLIC